MIVVGILLGPSCGCGEFVGAKPAGGFSTVPVDYSYKPKPNTSIWNLPHVDPRELPATLPVVDIPAPLKGDERMTFSGTIVPYDAGTEATLVRFEFRRRLSDGKYEDKVQVYQGMAKKKEDGQLHYTLPGIAPRQPGVYQYTLQSIGPSAAEKPPEKKLTELDSFVTGTFTVTQNVRPK